MFSSVRKRWRMMTEQDFLESEAVRLVACASQYGLGKNSVLRLILYLALLKGAV